MLSMQPRPNGRWHIVVDEVWGMGERAAWTLEYMRLPGENDDELLMKLVRITNAKRARMS